MMSCCWEMLGSDLRVASEPHRGRTHFISLALSQVDWNCNLATCPLCFHIQNRETRGVRPGETRADQDIGAVVPGASTT